MTMADTTSASVPLGRYLASTDKKTRDKAVKSLGAFLSQSQNALPESEMAKLWKGIFYCYWMSDKPLVQQALASELAGLLLAIPSSATALAFLRGFWEAILREWNGIDRLRMDKYYMLVRRFTYAGFMLLTQTEWEQSVVQEYNDILTCKNGPLCPDNTRIPSSLSYHLADIYLEELDKVLADSAQTKELPAPLSSILSPFIDLAALTGSSVTHQRIFTSLIEPLLTALKPQSSDTLPPSRKRQRLLNDTSYDHIVENACLERPKEEGKMERAQVRKALLRKMFDVASGPNVREANRRKMYAVWKVAIAEDDDGSRSDNQD